MGDVGAGSGNRPASRPTRKTWSNDAVGRGEALEHLHAALDRGPDGDVAVEQVEELAVEPLRREAVLAAAPLVQRVAPAVHQRGETAPAGEVEPGDVVAGGGDAPEAPFHVPRVVVEEAAEPCEPLGQRPRRVQLGGAAGKGGEALGRLPRAGGRRQRRPALVALLAAGRALLLGLGLLGDPVERLAPGLEALEPPAEAGVVDETDVELVGEVRLLGQLGQAVPGPALGRGGEERADGADDGDLAPGDPPARGGGDAEAVEGGEGEVHVGPGLAGDDGDPVERDAGVGEGADPAGDLVELALDVGGQDGVDGGSGLAPGWCTVILREPFGCAQGRLCDRRILLARFRNPLSRSLAPLGMTE